MNNDDLELVIKGKSPLVALETYDEILALKLLTEHGKQYFEQTWYWTLTEGLKPLGFGLELKEANQYAKPEAALEYIKQQSGSQLFIFCDMHSFLDEPKIIRLLKDLALNAESKRQKFILMSHKLDLPAELKRLSVLAELSLPNEAEILAIVRDEAKLWQQQNRGVKIRTDNTSLGKLVANLVGLPHADVRRLAHGAIADDGAITEDDLPVLAKAKFALMDMEGVLRFEYSTEHLKSVAGFTYLKEWLAVREPHMRQSEEADDIQGLDAPKGALLFGVQGGGKSLAAKAIAGMWGLPLLCLDMAALYNKYIGETERNLREALKLADLMSPCVLWVDEIEKGLAEDNENATGKRVLGTLLTWMAERKSRVFMVATSNDVSQLPPELMRKGRFDEIFFVDLPELAIREEIFKIHLSKRDLNVASFDLSELAEITDGFTGAEIEQAVVSALYSVSASAENLAQSHLLYALRNTQPLSVLRAEHIAQLREWSKGRAISV